MKFVIELIRRSPPAISMVVEVVFVAGGALIFTGDPAIKRQNLSFRSYRH